MLTLQQIYERISAHLLAQRAVSEDENGSCRLRGPQGRKCSIGSLIPDEHYSPALEDIGISYYRCAHDGPLLRALLAAGVDARQPRVLDLLIELEEVHDHGRVDEWPQRLASIGNRHGFAGCQPNAQASSWMEHRPATPGVLDAIRALASDAFDFAPSVA